MNASGLTCSTGTHRKNWRFFFHKAALAIGVLALLPAIAFAVYVTYRHKMIFDRLPMAGWHPARLTAPLSEADIVGGPVRWVEIDVTAAPLAAGTETRYRNTVESAGTLILHFKSAVIPTGRQTYRGILQIYRTRRARYRFPEALEQALRESGITPEAKFAVLSVDTSPWPLRAPRMEEGAVMASGICLALFLVVQWLRALTALFRPFAPTTPREAGADESRRSESTFAVCSRRIAAVSAAAALGWLIYRSLRYRPVIPAESLMALGLSSLLGLLITCEKVYVAFCLNVRSHKLFKWNRAS